MIIGKCCICGTVKNCGPFLDLIPKHLIEKNIQLCRPMYLTPLKI